MNHDAHTTPADGQRAAIYARVSTREQVERTSLGTQQERCRAYAHGQGWTVTATYVDEGISGAATSRPALDQLLRAVQHDEIDIVIVYKLDRLGRSMRHLTALLAEWDDRNVRLVSVSETFDSMTPTGRLMRNMLGSFAEFEREHIRSRALSTRDARVHAGRWPGGPAPFGWHLTRRDGDRHSTIEIDDDEAATIRAAHRLFVHERLSLWQTARQLNTDGHPPRGRAGQPGTGRWSHNSLRVFLRSADHLAGHWTYRRRHPRPDSAPLALELPPILNELELVALRARLAETARPAPRSRSGPSHLLSQRLRSPHDRPMYGVRQAGRPTCYICADAPGLSDRTHCHCLRINAELIEALVWDELRTTLTDHDRLNALAETAIGRHADDTADAESVATLARRVRELERALGDTLAALLADGYDVTAVQHATATLRQQLDLTKTRYQQALRWQAAHDRAVDHHQRISQLAASAVAVLDDPNPETRRRLVDLLDIHVHVTGWTQCPNCHGKGRTAEQRIEPSGPPRVPGNRIKVRSCPTCRGHRQLPAITVAGVLPAPATMTDFGDVAFHSTAHTA